MREVLQNFKADFDLTLGLSGCRSVAEIGPESLASAAERVPPAQRSIRSSVASIVLERRARVDRAQAQDHAAADDRRARRGEAVGDHRGRQPRLAVVVEAARGGR